MAIGGRAGESFTEINVTPLTDVFLVLLVIMILIAPLVNQAVLKVDPPQSGPNQQQEKPKDEPKLNVDVSKTGEIKINNQPVQSDTLAIMNAIKAEQNKTGVQDLPLILNSDEDALQKNVVVVMDAAAGCNLKKLSIMPPRKN
ncbi:MAG: biopolymer transporter ExbD [Candidatus Melainabacteria bacterium]|jgi:biopolymer transport protein ExbD|nr:biopolymer transporter ExbD [Candidatus Melainabacteria bacterium]MBX9674355.1 biopolymer transporter ExbD [Candidatus Obscuribacterales bacterium]